MRSLYPLSAVAALALGLTFAPAACAQQEEPAAEAEEAATQETEAAAEAEAEEAAPEKAKTKESVMLKACESFIAGQKIDLSAPAGSWKYKLPKPPQFDFDPEETIFWNLKTNKGDIKVKLMPEVAPMHVSSTVYLTFLGFYDGISFHRVIPDFMAQGGCPLGNGTGGPGYKYAGEFDPKVKHDRPGLLSMANAGPSTDGSQFFLTFAATPWLDGKHTIFGEVVEGMDTMKVLESLGTPPGTPKEKLLIEKATIEVK